MTARRHPPTLLLPYLPKQALVGIDFISLTASSRFNGFTALPPGWHFLFTGATTELSSRQGIWFYVPDLLNEQDPSNAGGKRQRADSQPLGVRGAIMKAAVPVLPEAKDWLAVLRCDAESESLCPVENDEDLEQWRARLLTNESLQKSLFPYRQSVQPDQRILEVLDDEEPNSSPPTDFVSMSKHISAGLLDRILGSSPNPFWTFDTASSTNVDAEAEHIPGLEGDEKFRGKSLGLMEIDLKKTWPDAAVGRERTEGARDRSWRLNQVVERTSTATEMMDEADVPTEAADRSWGDPLLGEMQFCFIAILTLANWSCMAQWRRILELVLTCSAIVPQRTHFFVSFLNVLSMQLTHTNLVEGGLFDVKDEGGAFLQRLLQGFTRTLIELGREHSGEDFAELKSEMSKLQETVRDIWGWELGDEWLRRGMVQLEDGEMVELETQDMEDEDERGEYAPVIVET